MLMGPPRLLPAADLSNASSDVIKCALTDAFEIGRDDGIAGRSDKLIQDPTCDEDVLRAYLRGWRVGAGELSDQECEALHGQGR
jgi:ribosome modulation factor